MVDLQYTFHALILSTVSADKVLNIWVHFDSFNDFTSSGGAFSGDAFYVYKRSMDKYIFELLWLSAKFKASQIKGTMLQNVYPIPTKQCLSVLLNAWSMQILNSSKYMLYPSSKHIFLYSFTANQIRIDTSPCNTSNPI